MRLQQLIRHLVSFFKICIMKNIIATLFVLFFTFGEWDLVGQCASNEHSNVWKDSWISCQTKASPNPARANSHWIMYDFGAPYNLTTTRVWNANEQGATNKGLKDIIVDYSLDGNTWTKLGNYQFNQAPGTNTYKGFAGPNFGGTNARYVLITVVTTWGNNCASLAEIKFNLGDSNLCTDCELGLKMKLQAADTGNGSLMTENLRTKGLIPMDEPFSGDPKFNHNGGERIENTSVLNLTGQNAIVDWVLIEFRPANNTETIVASRAALLQRDGDVVFTDGQSSLSAAQVPPGNYYICIQHRNHLPVMTAQPIQLGSTQSINFTNTNTATFGNNAQINLGGYNALWCGDLNGDNKIIFQGNNNDINTIFFDVLSDPNNIQYQSHYITEGYKTSDVNMDGEIIYQGINNDANDLFFNVLLHPENTLLSPAFIITSDVPRN